jgi:hypothetical protein
MGITDNFDVRRFAQANVAHGDKLVLLNKIASERIGWQGVKFRYNHISGKEDRIDEWIEQQSWQFSFIKKMNNNDTVDTVTADDMCNFMVTWFNGIGNSDLRNNGMSNLPIDPHSIMVYNDDSDLYQRRVVFTMEVQIPKSFRMDDDFVSVDTIVTHPV